MPFVIRLLGNYRVKGRPYTGKLNQIPLRKGQAVWWAGEEEPWHLATNRPVEQEVRSFYRQRRRIEQAFRDGTIHFKVGALKR
ncbi:MAG: hypothetical protein NZT92_12305 [Abditibacteriales bacterium]|nr:hypothetical protein [Abditibacteriales bacterium]